MSIGYSKIVAMKGKLFIKNKYICISYRGSAQTNPIAGGVSSALTAITNKYNFPWCFCCPPYEKRSKGLVLTKHLRGVPISEEEWRSYYLRACNTAIWPLFHQTNVKPVYKESWWKIYRMINKRMAQAALDLANKSKDVEGFFVNDFQLFLMGKYLRKSLKNRKLVFFLHIPWPNINRFSSSPWARRIIGALLSYDTVVLQTEEFRNNLVQTLKIYYPLIKKLDDERYYVHKKLTLRIKWAPIGIDYDYFLSLAKSKDIIDEPRLSLMPKKPLIFLGVDRLDYIKGVDKKIKWFGEFLSIHPEYYQSISLIQVLNPSSRASIYDLSKLENKIKKLVEKINHQHGSINWLPIRLISEVFDQRMLVKLYLQSSACIISSLHDGMNLISKEFVATNTNRPVSLIISNKCGASSQLNKGAILFNPYNKNQFIAALEDTLKMPNREKIYRVSQMVNNVREQNVYWWISNVLDW